MTQIISVHRCNICSACGIILLMLVLPAHMVCSSMEVGVCAEAYQGGEPTRHINSAFMTFEVLDRDRKPRTLPRIRPEPVVSSSSVLFLHLKSPIMFTKCI